MKQTDRHVAQYNKFAKIFKKADETFPDVTRTELYKLSDDIFLYNETKLKLSYLNQEFPKLLDLGCGYGKDLEHFSRGEIDIYGVDSSIEMLKLAKKRVPLAKLKEGNFYDLPFKTNFFDMVFSRYAIQHAADTERVFREVYRVLKPNGKLVFLVTHPIRHYFEKQTKDYWKQEDINSDILDGKLTVTEPSHTLQEYISPFLLSYFDLEAFLEKEDPAAKKFEGFGNYPRILLARYRKRPIPQLSPIL